MTRAFHAGCVERSEAQQHPRLGCRLLGFDAWRLNLSGRTQSYKSRASARWLVGLRRLSPTYVLLWLLIGGLPGCASIRTLDAAKPGAPIIYSGTRLDWYSLNGGCCPKDRFGALAPRYAALDLPASALLDTLLLPFAVAAELGVGLGVTGGN